MTTETNNMTKQEYKIDFKQKGQWCASYFNSLTPEQIDQIRSAAGFDGYEVEVELLTK